MIARERIDDGAFVAAVGELAEGGAVLTEAVFDLGLREAAELAEFARVIEARRKGFYETDESERRALAEGLGDAENGRFASESMLEASAKRFGA